MLEVIESVSTEILFYRWMLAILSISLVVWAGVVAAVLFYRRPVYFMPRPRYQRVSNG